MLAIAARIVDRARESVIDRLAIHLFFWITRHTSLRILRCFHLELVNEICDRLAAEIPRPDASKVGQAASSGEGWPTCAGRLCP